MSADDHLFEAESNAFTSSITSALELFQKSIQDKLDAKNNVIRRLQSEVDDCKKENARLNVELAATLSNWVVEHKKQNRASPVLNQFPPKPQVPSSGEPVPYDDYSQLATRFNDLKQNVQTFEIANRELARKNRKLKETVKEWQRYAEKCNRKAEGKSTEKDLAIPHLLIPALSVSDFSSRPSTSSSEGGVKGLVISRAQSPLVPPNYPENIMKRHEHGPGQLNGNGDLGPTTSIAGNSGVHANTASAEMDNDPSRHEIPRSSQRTQSDDSSQQMSEDAPASPSRVAANGRLFAGPVKIKKRKHGDIGSQSKIASVSPGEEGSPVRSIHIKLEPNSSPVRHSTIRELTRTDTLDLDEVGDRIDTPRKRRRVEELLRQNSSIQSLQFIFGLKDEPLDDLSDPVINERNNMSEVDPITWRTSENLNRVPQDQQLRELLFDASIKTEPGQSGRPRAMSSRELQPLGPNQRTLPRTSPLHERDAQLRDPERGAKHLHILAEDGNFSSRHADQIPPNKKEKANRRLESLLDGGPIPTKQPFTPAGQNIQRKAKPNLTHMETPKVTRGLRDRATPTYNELPPPKTAGSTSRTKGHLPTTNSSKSTVKRARLREKPLTALRPEDFKASPKAHGGLDLTTADPIRGREARRHLPGCTDPSCVQCGDQLRTLAANLPITVGSALFASTQDEDLTEEEKLIKYFLGSDFDRDQVSQMDSKAREDLLLRAKTDLIAERHIRHRVRPNARAKTPPGFWNTDMPTTQEFDAQREEADRIQRQIVEERYREAMKSDGKWIFRDE